MRAFPLRHSRRGDGGNEVAQSGAELTEFLKVDGGQALDHLLAMAGETQFHAASVRRRRGAAEKPAAHQPVNQADRAVVPNLEVVSEFSDERVLAAREPFQNEQGLMLLHGESCAAGGLFAEVQKDPQRVADGGQRLIVGFTEANRWHFL